MTTALVLSGGGARGAYEVGVLSYLCGELCSTGALSSIDLVCGTSVGAINGAYLASIVHEPEAGMARLVELWQELSLSDVLGFSFLQARRLHRVLLGGRKGAGFFDATPMTRIIRGGIDYRRLARNIRERRLLGLTVTATHMPTGRPTVFVDRAVGTPMPEGMPSSVRVRPARIMPYHVLASAAIPVIFPPVFIRTDLYCDGGLRLNTPLSPALRMGASRVLVIGMTPEDEAREEVAPGRFPGLPFLAGKVLDAFLLDHVNLDLEELDRVNAFLRDGIAAYGPDFLERTNEAARARGAPPRQVVEAMVIRPSQDIGALAADFLRRERSSLRSLLRLTDVGEGADAADLASYLLFDGRFAAELISLGRRDAARRRDDLLDFLRPG